MKKGLPADDGPEKLPADFEIKIGKVRAFAVEVVEAHNTLESGKWIRVEFTKSLSPLLKEADAPQWVSVTPAPAKLRYDLGDSSIAVHGDFQLEQHYTVTVNQGVPAEEPFTLAATFTKDATFTPIPPRLYFPALTTTQLSSGRRAFGLKSINLPAVALRARLLDRDSVVFALAGYQQQLREKTNAHGSDLEPYQRLSLRTRPRQNHSRGNDRTTAPLDQARTIRSPGITSWAGAGRRGFSLRRRIDR